MKRNEMSQTVRSSMLLQPWRVSNTQCRVSNTDAGVSNTGIVIDAFDGVSGRPVI